MNKEGVFKGMQVQCVAGPQKGRKGVVTHLMNDQHLYCEVRYDATPYLKECTFAVYVRDLRPVNVVDRLGGLTG